MARTYTDEQFAAFEQHHGAGMVLIFSVGEDEYAFRRLSALDVDIALADKEAGKMSFHEEAAIRCVLTADAPHAGASGQDAKLSKDDLALIVAERARLALEWKDAAMMRDMIGLALAGACGWFCTPEQEAIGGGLHSVRLKLYEQTPGAVDGETIQLTARGWTDREYDEYRRLSTVGVEGEAERYAYGKLITSPNKAAVERLYPYLVYGAGKCLQVIGVTKAVRLKKSNSGQAAAPGNSTSTEGPAISP